MSTLSMMSEPDYLDVSPGDKNSNAQTAGIENLYMSFLDNTFELLFRSSMEDKLMFFNRVFMDSLGFDSFITPEGFNLMLLFENIDAYCVFKQKVLLQKRVSNEIVHFKALSGKRLIGLVNCQLSQTAGTDEAFNWTVLDITQRIDYEESLKTKNDELEKLNTRMEKFLYSTSHDLRSPLTSIMGLTNLIRMETKDSSMQDYAEKIEVSALRLDKIIHDLQGFTKASYQQMKTKKVNFDELVWDIIDRYADEPDFKQIHFEVSAEEKFPFFGDHERLEIILDNIIRNSIHFYDRNKIRSFIRISIVVHDMEITIEILDNGIGIEKTHQSQIFNMFYKASHQSRGAGLGLYVVKDSLSQLNGTVSVESEIGFGSLFRIRIPNDHKGLLIRRKLQLKAD